MAIHLRERRIRLSPEVTKEFERWLRTNKLIEEIKPSMVRYPTMDEIVRKMEAEKKLTPAYRAPSASKRN
jgi:hypothetical protein